jgi:hypothetical protein
MNHIRTLAAYEVVQLTFPRVPSEAQELGMVVGKVIDTTLSRYSHEFDRRLRPTVTAMHRFAEEQLERELRDIDMVVPPAEKQRALDQIAGTLQAFRRTEVFGLPRPRTRLVLIDEQVGVYTQPDYWDRKSRFYEMKSYRAVPPSPAVALQLRLFQLGFPELQGFLLCVDRHSVPPEASITPLAPLDSAESNRTLRLALDLGLSHGHEKILDYVDSPVVRHSTAGAMPGT